MKSNNDEDGKRIANVNGKITENKRRIKILTDINAQLTARRSQENKVKSLRKEVEELENELKGIQQKVNNAWKEKIESEKRKGIQLEEELKDIVKQIEAHADTPGYQQAVKHTNVQADLHKHNGPSVRSNYKNMASRLQSEIKSLKDVVNKAKLSLIEEIKKKTALEEEVREIRTSMTHRRSVTPSSTFLTSSIPDLNLHSATR